MLFENSMCRVWCSIEMRNSWAYLVLVYLIVVIWCSIEMRNSMRAAAEGLGVVVIWCSIEMRNSLHSVWHMAVWVVIWCSIEMRNSQDIIYAIDNLLWFDALLKWETVTRIWPTSKCRCDLMLYWNEKQLDVGRVDRRDRCDLMLYWNEKQSLRLARHGVFVVIWCSIEMRNSVSDVTDNPGCVVIWCSIEMRNSTRSTSPTATPVVIWCSIEMRNSILWII